MKKIITLSLFFSVLIGQLLPTIPRNVFRLSIGSTIQDSKWDMDNNSFSLRGLGKRYFDIGTHSDSLRFSSNFDLYHNGSAYIDSNTTIEQWMNNFNDLYGFSLPVFGAQSIDTTRPMESAGVFSESRKRSISSKYLKID